MRSNRHTNEPGIRKMMVVALFAAAAIGWGAVFNTASASVDMQQYLQHGPPEAGFAIANDTDYRGTNMELIALTKIRCDGKMIQPGTTFESDDTGLIECGAAKPAAELDSEIDDTLASDVGSNSNTTSDEEEAEAVTLSEADAQERAEQAGGPETDRPNAINATLAAMLEEDPEKQNETLWKQDGSPRVKAVTVRAGVEATAEEIATEWAIMSAPVGDGDEVA